MKLKRLVLFAIFTVFLFGVVQAATFSDLSTNHWAYKNINEMYDKGFVSGYTDGTFKPDKAITREEFVTILSKFLDLKPSPYAIKCIDVESDRWSAEYINSMNLYLRPDRIDGLYYFKPSEAVLRKDVAGAIAGVLGLYCSTEVEILDTLEQFSDIDELKYDDQHNIAKAVANGVMKGNPDGTFNPNGVLTRAEVAALMCNLSKNQKFRVTGSDTISIEPLSETVDIGKVMLNNAFFIVTGNKFYFLDDELYRCDLDGTKKEKINLPVEIRGIEFGYGNLLYCTADSYYNTVKINFDTLEIKKLSNDIETFVANSIYDGEVVVVSSKDHSIGKLNLFNDEYKCIIEDMYNTIYFETIFEYKGNIYYGIESESNEIYCNGRPFYKSDKKINNLIFMNDSMYIIMDDEVSQYSFNENEIVMQKFFSLNDYNIVSMPNSEYHYIYENGKLYEFNKYIVLEEVNYNQYNPKILLDKEPYAGYVINNKLIIITYATNASPRDILVYDLTTGNTSMYKDIDYYNVNSDMNVYIYYENSSENKISTIDLTKPINESKIISLGHEHKFYSTYKDNCDGKTHLVEYKCSICGEVLGTQNEPHYSPNADGKCEKCSGDAEELQIIWLFDGTPKFYTYEDEKILKFAIKGEGNKKVTYYITSYNKYYIDDELASDKQYTEYISEPYKEIELNLDVQSNSPILIVTVENERGKKIQKVVDIVVENRYVCWTDLSNNEISACASAGLKIFKYMVVEGDSLQKDSKIIKYDAFEYDESDSNYNQIKSYKVDLTGIPDNTDITILILGKHKAKLSTGETTLAGRTLKDVYRLENGKLFFKSTGGTKEYLNFPDSPEYKLFSQW